MKYRRFTAVLRVPGAQCQLALLSKSVSGKFAGGQLSTTPEGPLEDGI